MIELNICRKRDYDSATKYTKMLFAHSAEVQLHFSYYSEF